MTGKRVTGKRVTGNGISHGYFAALWISSGGTQGIVGASIE